MVVHAATLHSSRSVLRPDMHSPSHGGAGAAAAEWDQGLLCAPLAGRKSRLQPADLQRQGVSRASTGTAPRMQVQAAARRRAAAEWVEGLTGIALPTSSDHAFRGALRDGVLLCRILDLLRPGMVAKVGPVLASLNIIHARGWHCQSNVGAKTQCSCHRRRRLQQLPAIQKVHESIDQLQQVNAAPAALAVWEFLTPACCRWQGLKLK